MQLGWGLRGMRRALWLLATLLTLSAGQAVGQPAHQPPTQQAAAQKPAPPPATAHHAANNPNGCKGAKPTEDDQLCYERRSAEADEEQATQARKANGWAKSQFWIAVTGTVAIVVTLGLTARGIGLAERALSRVERAFVFMESLEPGTVAENLLLGPRWKNSGATPAARGVLRCSWKTFLGDIPGDFDYPDLGSDGKPAEKFSEFAPIFLGPGASVLSHGISIPMEVFKKVAAGSATLMVWGWIEYDDILFGPRHRTEFCQVASILEDKATTGDQRQASLRFRNHCEHNGADEDCMKPPSPYPGHAFQNS